MVNFFALSGFFWWYAYDQSQIKAQREEAYKAFWHGDSVAKAAQYLWETQDKQIEEAFKDSVRHGLFRKQTQTQSVMTWVIPEIPDLSSQVATLMFWIATSTIGALVTALVFIYKERMELVKSFLPLLSEIKVFLQQNLNK